MQGDVLGPLVSSNMVDKHIGKVAIESGNVYMYKDKVPVPPLAMVDDTLGVSVCGYRTNKMNTFLNTRTSIMGLQFGCDKCEKLHVCKKQNEDICQIITVDSWEEEAFKCDEKWASQDMYRGKESMSEVKETKYLGDVIQNNGSNKSNIKKRTEKAHGNVHKIVTSLKERPYGKHYFKAAMLMRQGMLVSSMLTNSEGWINLTKTDIEELDKPDITLQRKVLASTGNPSKCFMNLELGIIPVKYVIQQKRLNFLHYILNEPMESLVKQVYLALKEDSRKGDFVHLLKLDKDDLEIDIEDDDIQEIPKEVWKKYVREKVRDLAFKQLVDENNTKEKTKSIYFSELKISEYLENNMNTALSKLIFSVRSKTLSIKEWSPWQYTDDTCVVCKNNTETMNHFMICQSYKNKTYSEWNDIFGNNYEKQISAGIAIEKRFKEREAMLEIDKIGRDQGLDSTAPGDR